MRLHLALFVCLALTGSLAHAGRGKYVGSIGYEADESEPRRRYSIEGDVDEAPRKRTRRTDDDAGEPKRRLTKRKPSKRERTARVRDDAEDTDDDRPRRRRRRDD